MKKPPFETFKGATCKGCYTLGTACGKCEKCEWERAQVGFSPPVVKSRPAPVERQPFNGYCANCKHEWVLFYVPMDLAKVGEIGKRAICPACGETKVMCGKAP
jgi:hypothetical protein